MTKSLNATGSGLINESFQNRAPTYEEVSVDIERIVSMKASKYNIPDYDRDDIAQEIRMVAFKALSKFDPAKNNRGPFHFIARCVDNYLINLRRDNDAVISKKKMSVADQSTLKKLEEKRKIYYPASLDADDYTNSLKVTPQPDIDVHDRILHFIPSGLHASYWLIVKNGQDAAPAAHLVKIKQIIKSLYSND